MRIFRVVFRAIFIVFCLFIGLCIADKERYSNSVVGVCVFSEQSNTFELSQLRDFISHQDFQDANELCMLIGSKLLDNTAAYAYLGRQYFEQTDGFPNGVYDTVYIVLGGDFASQLPQMQLLYAADNYIPYALPDIYFAALSFVGKIEKAILNRISALDF